MHVQNASQMSLKHFDMSLASSRSLVPMLLRWAAFRNITQLSRVSFYLYHLLDVNKDRMAGFRKAHMRAFVYSSC